MSRLRTFRRVMPARAPAVRLLRAPGHEGLPLHSRVYRQLRDHILGAGFGPGARLPSARGLAADLAVSRNTVEAALAQLRAEGFIERRTGSGTYVAASLPESAPFRAGAAGRPPEAAAPVPARCSARGRLTAQLGGSEIEAEAQLGPCAADVDGFPLSTWNRLLARRVRLAGRAALLPADPAGVPALRHAIAEHLRLTRGVRCGTEQVLVLNSTQQAIDLAVRLLLDPGQQVAVEDPGYPSARATFRAAGTRVRPVPVDDEGLVAARLPPRGVRLLYVTPSHQYPLGGAMCLSRRLAAVRWAAATGAWILEDDYDSEFRYAGRPLAALQGLDTAGRTLYAGTFNKVLFPGLRLAYLVLPPELVDSFSSARRLLDGYSPPLGQLVLADFLTQGHFTTHLRRVREHYLARRDALLAAVAECWGGRVRLGPSDTGLHLVAHLPPGTDDERLARAAPRGGMGVAPLSHYYLGRTRRAGLLLSFGATAPDRIRRTVQALARLIPENRAGRER